MRSANHDAALASIPAIENSISSKLHALRAEEKRHSTGKCTKKELCMTHRRVVSRLCTLERRFIEAREHEAAHRGSENEWDGVRVLLSLDSSAAHVRI